MKVLIDRNIERNAIVYISAKVPKTLRWGGQDITRPVLERHSRLPREDETFRRTQLPYLATVGELARAGKVRLFRSPELLMEWMRQRSPDPGYVGLSFLENVEIEKITSPVAREVSIGHKSVGVTEEEQMEFFRSILDPRFLEIRNAISDPSNLEAHIDDAFHLWSAETAILDAFLTLDKAFIEVMSGKGRRAKSPVSVWSPKDLCTSLGEGPTDIEAISAKYPPFR